MLTQEIIKSNPLLSVLSDDQINAIAEMSKNDESSVISKKTSTIYNNLDENLLKVSGITRNGDEKSYDYLTRVVEELKAKADHTPLTEEIESLKSQLEGKTTPDKALLDKIASLESELNPLRTSNIELKNHLSAKDAEYQNKLNEYKFDSMFNSAASGIQFANDNKELNKVLIESTINQIKSEYTFVNEPDGSGYFLDKGNNKVLNKQNDLRPSTASDLLIDRLSSLGVLKEQRNQKGGGSGIQPPGSGRKGQYSTKEEAIKGVKEQLAKDGITVFDTQYNDALQKGLSEVGYNEIDK